MSIITDTTDYSCAVAVFLTRALAFNYLMRGDEVFLPLAVTII